jgi:sugar/nucleoside kinase (ribokinase family)
MSNAAFDVVGIGDAILDVIARADDSFIAAERLAKGTMALIDAARAESLYQRMGAAIETSGGSAANTIAGVASLGGTAAFIGKVHDDLLGRVFTHDLRALGVRFDTPPLRNGPPTARCLIMVTPDAQRTMCTYLGACIELGPEDVSRELIAAGQVTYLEGYLFDPPRAKDAFRAAAEFAHAAGRKVSLSLSDPFCVDRHRGDFRAFIDRHVDILFANEAEICSLYETKSFAEAARAVAGECQLAVLTRSERGSLIVTPDDSISIDAAPVAQVVDTTGAGDLYASGFLYGLTHGSDLAACGRLASLCAAEVISHMGPRPQTSLADLAREARLI